MFVQHFEAALYTSCVKHAHKTISLKKNMIADTFPL